jgi:sugar fermentation stimulation protein A
MLFSPPLLPGRLIKRYKRFLADIELASGKAVTAHCVNPGALLGVTTPGLAVWVSHNPDPKRKLAYTWQVAEVDGAYVGVNTSLPNRLAEEAILEGKIPELFGYQEMRREVKYGQNSRIDWLLKHPGKPDCYVEVKNVHLKRGAGAEFPDSVTSRGAKHLRELETIAATGSRAIMLYIIQRNDCSHLSFAADIDPLYATAAAHAFAHGVEALAYECTVTPAGIAVERQVGIEV